MTPVAFKDISAPMLVGEWRLQSRILNSSEPDYIFAKSTQHSFLSGGKYRNELGDEGISWHLMHESDFDNPIIEFTSASISESALITRFLRSVDSAHAQLTIYFTNGLELVLLK